MYNIKCMRKNVLNSTTSQPRNYQLRNQRISSMIHIIKLPIVILLFVPAIILTIFIWIFGGWTQGFDYMPNPIYKLFDWLELQKCYNIHMPLILICILLYPVHTTEYIPDNSLEYWQQKRLDQLKDNAEKLYIINANINYLQ